MEEKKTERETSKSMEGWFRKSVTEEERLALDRTLSFVVAAMVKTNLQDAANSPEHFMISSGNETQFTLSTTSRYNCLLACLSIIGSLISQDIITTFYSSINFYSTLLQGLNQLNFTKLQD